MQRSDFRFFERLRVRWAEIDAQKIVFNGHYLMYFDTAVAGYWRALALPYADSMLFDRFESGQPMVDVRVGDWSTLGEPARAIRSAVFIGEQKIPADMEWDDADEGAVHAVAFNHLGRALATGRMMEHVPGVAKIGRMAVTAGSRHSGVGRAVLDALLDAARARGDREVVLHAQITAAPFYERAGFMRRGPVFDETGIAHVEMLRTL
jgi:predicted GNAT family N-acyltransferase